MTDGCLNHSQSILPILSEFGKYPLEYYERNWEDVQLTEADLDAICNTHAGDVDAACAVIDAAYERAGCR